MICITVDSNGFITQAQPNEFGGCDNLVAISVTEFAGSFSQITAEQILVDFSWGFGAVVFFWSLGATIGAAKTAIQKL